MDFSSKQKDFCQRRTRFFGMKSPSVEGPFNTQYLRVLEVIGVSGS